MTVGAEGVDAPSLTKDTVASCKQIKDSLRYCPNKGFDVKKEPLTCATALYAGKSDQALKLCPVSLLNEEYVHIASLG